MEPQMFAVVDAENHDVVYCIGVDTGDGAFTFRRDPQTHGTVFGSSASMYSAFTRASKMVRDYGRLELVIYNSTVDNVVAFKEGVCPVCDNERRVSLRLDEMIPQEVAAELDDTIPCPECTDEHGNVRALAR